MVLPSSGTITLEEIRNEYLSDTATGGWYNLLAYRGTSWNNGSTDFTASTGQLDIEWFYGKAGGSLPAPSPPPSPSK